MCELPFLLAVEANWLRCWVDLGFSRFNCAALRAYNNLWFLSLWIWLKVIQRIQIGMPITLNNELAGFRSDGLFFRCCHCTATCPQSLTTSNIKYVLIGLKQPDVTAFLTLLDHELEHGLVLATRLPWMANANPNDSLNDGKQPSCATVFWILTAT